MNAGHIDAALMFCFYSLAHYILENVSNINGIVLCVIFVDQFLYFRHFSFSHCVVCPSLTYGHQNFANGILNQIRIFE